ncbi:MAG TPA: hypothetical protein V6C76_14475 [Drouetiella sp.]
MMELAPQLSTSLPKAPQRDHLKASKKLKVSAGLMACAIFATMNIGLLFVYQVRNLMSSDAKNLACATGSFSALTCLHDMPLLMWAIQNSYERILDSGLHEIIPGSPPEVVLLGSSIMQLPTWFADKGDILPDQAYYYFRSASLEKKCATKRGILNLACPLTYASDVARIVEDRLSGTRKPDVIVYGIAPRDLFDNSVGEPNKSQFFAYLAKRSDYLGNSDSYFSNVFDGAYNLILQGLFIYQKRNELIELAKMTGKEILRRNKPVEPAPVTMDIKRNLDEYRAHYENLNVDALNRQLKFLEALLATCERRQIRVILISMPLTNENKALLAKQLYPTFNQKLSTLANIYHQKLFQPEDRDFESADFMDSVHLNARGSKKFIAQLVPLIRHELSLSHQQ